ncbi:MAG: GNAT family N-acetyltransferase [Clostridium sp.]|nr:MAG: GNAT family N-acetyltransferase [Clostridium sp.]
MDYKIRKANIKDAKSVNELLTLLIRDEKKYDININEECTIERLYEDIIPNENSIVLIAEKDKKILGYLFGYIIEKWKCILRKKSAKLEALYIDEKNIEKNGIAASLIEKKFKIWSKRKRK